MFKDTLQTVVEKTDGALGALIMGADGLPVEKYFSEHGRDANLDIAAAELTTLVRTAGRSGSDLDFGSLCELVVAFDKVTFVIRSFSRDYFAVLALNPDGNIGRGRYELRKAELILANEFAL